MINNKRIQIEIANILRRIGSKKCLEKADRIAHESSSLSVLNLRDLELNSSNITSIVSCLKQEEELNNHLLKSISFSYNHLLGDLGAIALTKSLPKSICEIGLVNCGISDVGGVEILSWMKTLPNLQMICMEQNNLSEKLRIDLHKFKDENPKIMVVI